MFDFSILGIHLWQWALSIVILVLLYPVSTWIMWLAGRIMRVVNPERAESFERFFAAPLKFLMWVLLARALSPLVGPSVAFSALMQVATLPLLLLAWLLIRMVDFSASRMMATLDSKGLAGARVLVTPVSRLVKLVMVTGIILLWLDNMGFKVTTLLAGLSISGVAVALASQKSLENIFGALTLFSSQPVRVGDFCRFGDKVGTVEEIGLRATRIRTLDRSVITVANGEFANLHLDNYSFRDRFWYHPEIGLRYETTPDQIRYILVEIQKMLYAHPKVLPDPLWVRFLGFGDYALNVGVFAYIGVTDYTESLEVAEDLNLRIMDIVAAAGSDFAFPAKIQYELPGKPIDESRVQAVEAEVKEWKAQKALYLPRLPKEKVAEIRGSLDYPPHGSPGAVLSS
jgi:MscS family membrane protein